jgi:hypothetical protein
MRALGLLHRKVRPLLFDPQRDGMCRETQPCRALGARAALACSHAPSNHVTPLMLTQLPAGCAPESSFISALLNHFVGAHEDRPRNRQAERPRGLQVDDKLALRRLLDRQFARLRTLEDLVDVDSGTPV